jgi:hypothetical protein
LLTESEEDANDLTEQVFFLFDPESPIVFNQSGDFYTRSDMIAKGELKYFLIESDKYPFKRKYIVEILSNAEMKFIQVDNKSDEEIEKPVKTPVEIDKLEEKAEEENMETTNAN